MPSRAVDELRPRSFGDIVGQEKAIQSFTEWIEAKNMPNCIFVGPPGSGKTTAMYCLISGMFGGYDMWDGPNHPDFLQMNASDERGIDVVRGKIKEFAGVGQPKTNVPFRIVVLEEGDQLTTDAQNTLRFTTEEGSPHCRFIFLGNDESYIEAIKSRCALFRFEALPAEKAGEYFEKACKKYGVKIAQGVSQAVGLFYQGDMRRMFNDCFEKIRYHKGVVELKDLYFSSSVRAVVADVLAILASKDAPATKYLNARKKFTAEHAKTHFDLRRFVAELEEMMGEMAFDLAEYFSEIDDRLRTSERNKEIHVGALLAAIAKGGATCKT